ncbi:MAG: hypothetical protein H6748_10945 [Spirochaetaceae bacterium]|nr:hypothetical protein [Myxococcales bacterium]MCB9724551.1 hypothetical protein [Spirochaetaceae bacterium]HPG25928.1 polyhydroxyalkanoate synthesis regulator DNA-binding domain-containing protein [Myxococcota bacterium]
MAILIKRYANRKLYNTETSRYITLKGIAQLLDEGEEVRVVDNESGEDITQVALSQILVDSKRAKEDPSATLLSQILTRGSDALYGALRKSVDDATENLGEFQDRFRHFVNQAESRTTGTRGFGLRERREPEGDEVGDARTDRPGADSVAALRDAIEEVLDEYDLPTRREIDRLNRNLERVAEGIERLEKRSTRID